MLAWARQLSGSPRPSHGPGVSNAYCPTLACAPQGQTSVTSAKQGPKKDGELWPWAPRSHLPHFLVLAITQAFLIEPRILAVVAGSHVGMSQVLLRLKQWPRAEVMAPWMPEGSSKRLRPSLSNGYEALAAAFPVGCACFSLLSCTPCLVLQNHCNKQGRGWF